MRERRPLTEGLKTPVPPADPAKEKTFVFGEKTAGNPETLASAMHAAPAQSIFPLACHSALG